MQPELTWWRREALTMYSPNTVRAYLYALIRYFSWLDLAHLKWDAPSCSARGQFERYLIDALGCQIRPHKIELSLLAQTRENTAQIGQILAAAQSFYLSAIRAGLYGDTSPLLVASQPKFPTEPKPLTVPAMPQISGVTSELHKRQRLTSCYYVRTGSTWVPQVINHPNFAGEIFEGGKRLNWPLRNQVVTRLLFETGARISEICGLAVSDWLNCDAGGEASAFNKGSRSVRTKRLRFSETTAKLLRHYVDHDRSDYDPQHRRLIDFQALDDPTQCRTDPLFLTRIGTALTPALYRTQLWRPACALLGLQSNVHQARHWYVTSALLEIDTLYPDPAERARRKNMLIAYMGWRSGIKTLESYDHTLDQGRHAEVHALLQARLDSAMWREDAAPYRASEPSTPPTSLPEDPDWQLLQRLGAPLS
ncbi:tyrosine-type recombinase/integrase [Ralstonia mannitolilytica]|uniref:tyrosine-type recombinase/integrase n=1 Tax=Ralstonia mannitolilytica TaxID=105219 RepID=UPI002930346A|nr:tyrosine-type recombinase/integrase [Ralstonia mannitolilytica]